MLRMAIFGSVLLGVSGLCGELAAAERSDENSARDGAVALQTRPRVPTRAALLKDTPEKHLDIEKESELIQTWAAATIAGKQKRAEAELETLKKHILEEAAERQRAERERQRRQEKYNESWGALGSKTALPRTESTRIRLDFQVPEIESYRLAAAVCRARESLANDIVEFLPRLDRNADGELTGDEYHAAGALLAGLTRLFLNLDQNADGWISDDELSAANELPAGAAAAIRAGKRAASAPLFRIAVYDANQDGILDVAERKALTMAFVETALQAGAEAAFYTRVAGMLTAARKPVADKFANIEITP